MTPTVPVDLESKSRLAIIGPFWGVSSMTTMFVRHTVSNYKAWRKAYDDFAPVQKKAKGVTAQAVYQAADNPNDLT
jgi:hypothetical protein